MKTEFIYALSLGIIIILLLIILYQRITYRKGIRREIENIGEKIAEIRACDTYEKMMIFTDEQALIKLGEQINALLIERQKRGVDFQRGRMATKKMLANISHDMKTPLTVILGYLEIIRMKYSEDTMLQKVEAQAQQMLDLVGKFFTLAKLEAGDTDVSFSKIEVGELCRKNILSFYSLLQQDGFEVVIDLPKYPVYVNGNEDAISRILANLISNVIRYGSDGGYIGIMLRLDTAHVYIDVVDKGKGIPQECADFVFERLYTVEDSRNRELQGNGLGLAIAKNLAEQINGQLTLLSEPYVQTIFTLKLARLL